MYRSWLFLPILLLSFLACRPEAPEVLPVIGFKEVDTVTGDTIYQTIGDFSFINQDGEVVNNQTFEGKAYLVDFFFLNCPTICPKVSKQMLRLYEEFEDQDEVLLLAHTLDPKRDTRETLQLYAENMGVNASKWHFVTGNKDELYAMADDYFSVALENPDAPGGIDHSGRIILVDPQGRVRSFANGTDPEKVTELIEDVRILLKEMKANKS